MNGKIPFITSTKQRKLLRINLRNVQNLNKENQKTFLEDSKLDLNKCKDIPCSSLGCPNIKISLPMNKFKVT